MDKLDKKFLLSIKEFGKLTNIHPKSLRYYDSIGVLKPAMVDPENGYRYYTYYQKEEAFLLQMLLECDIPLKDSINYLSQDKVICYETLIQDMVSIMEQKIKKLQKDIQHMRGFHETYAHASQLISSKCPIQEIFPEQEVFRIPFTGKQFTPQWQSSVKEISNILSKYNMLPIYTGLMAVWENGCYQQYLYASFSGAAENMKYPRNEQCVKEAQRHPCYFQIPGGKYLCSAVPESGLEQAQHWATDHIHQEPKLIFELEMISGDYHYFPPKLEQRILMRRDDT